MHNTRKINQLYGWGNFHGEAIIPGEHTDALKISIVVPTLNQGTTIEDTLLSIVNQMDKNYEIIVIDGGSTDDTPDIIAQYKKYIAHYESRKDNGQSDAINKGFRHAKGDIYAWLNSDDYYLPGAFHAVRNAFRENQNVDIVVGSGDVVTRDCQFLKQIDSLKMERDILLGWHNDQWIMQQCCFWTKGIWDRCRGVDENLHLLMDYDLWLRFADAGESVAIDNRVAIMRYYEDTKTIAMRNTMKEEEAYVYAKNHAFIQLRSMVKELCICNEQQGAKVTSYENHFITRLLKRINLIKT